MAASSALTSAVQLHVANLPWTMEDDSTLFDVFSPHGASSAHIVRSSDTGHSKGFGFATFPDDATAEAARTALDGRNIGGRVICVRVYHEPSTAAAVQQYGGVTVAIVGAGNRGQTYAKYALDAPERMRVVAVAEPREYVRKDMCTKYGIPDGCAFASWEEMVAAGKLADAVVIATQDSMHVAPALAFAAQGYHILLEKPMALTPADCIRITDACTAAKVMLAVGHVLRYTPYMTLLISLLRKGAIGRIVTINHVEPVGHEHFAHSYVRGNWRAKDASSFMLMTKCCHDIDLIRHMMGSEDAPVSIASFGSLMHFKRENKPEAAGDATRCVACAYEPKCAFSARRIYEEPASAGNFGWPVSVILDGEPSLPAVRTALEVGPYGRCVYTCDNDVVDHQVVAMNFASGATATLTTTAFTRAVCVRSTRITGTAGELEGDGESTVKLFDFQTRRTETFTADCTPHGSLGGHGGADYCLISSFIQAVATGDAAFIRSGPEESLQSHLLVFAAEAARIRGTVINVVGGDLRAAAAAYPVAAAAAPSSSAATGAASIDW